MRGRSVAVALAPVLTLALALTLPLTLVACSVGSADGELRMSTWPQSGLGGFRLLTSDEAPRLSAPYVLLPLLYDVDEPTALLPDPALERLRLYVRATPRGGASFIGAAELSVLEDGADEVTQALVADQPWEGAGLRTPSVLPAPGDPAGRVWLLYQGQRDGSIGLSAGDPGTGLSKGPGPLLSAAQVDGEIGGSAVLIDSAQRSGAPSIDDGDLIIYYLRADATVWRARTSLAEVQAFLDSPPSRPAAPTWQIVGPVLTAADFTVPLSSVQSAAGEALRAIGARRLVTPAGRARYDLFLSTEARGKRALCAASSYDGLSFAPLLDPALRVQQEVPGRASVLLYRQRPLMLLGLRIGRTGIGAARIP